MSMLEWMFLGVAALEVEGTTLKRYVTTKVCLVVRWWDVILNGSKEIAE